MKIVLINPPRENEIIGNNPSLIEEERGFNPPLGLLYIASYLEKFTEYSVIVIDAQVEKLNYNDLASRIASLMPDVVGITAMTLTLVDVIKTLEVVKKINKSVITVVGGPHVNLFPEETVRLINVDYVVLGEGEKTFKDLLGFLDDKSKLGKIPGLLFKNGNNIINTGANETIKNLDDIPSPARHMVPWKQYTSLLAKSSIVTTIITSRGCPYRCSFCDRPHLGKLFRARSAKNVVDELEVCTKMGIFDFLFYDDTFAVNKKRVIDICNEILRRKLNISWDIRTRVDTIDEEILKHLKKAGCQSIHYGIEAGTEKILGVLNKGITLEQVKCAFNLTKKYKMSILAYFMIGNPTETKDDIYLTFKVMRMLNPDYVHLTILTPFPGTKIYSDGLNKGIIKEDYWKHFAENPTSNFIPPHWNEMFSRSELNDLLVKGYHSFYLRPLYLLKNLVKVKSTAELKKKFKAGIKIFRMKN